MLQQKEVRFEIHQLEKVIIRITVTHNMFQDLELIQIEKRQQIIALRKTKEVFLQEKQLPLEIQILEAENNKVPEKQLHIKEVTHKKDLLVQVNTEDQKNKNTKFIKITSEKFSE